MVQAGHKQLCHGDFGTVTRESKKDPAGPGRFVDTWVGPKPRTTFDGLLRAFKKKYKLDQSDYRHYRGSAEEAVGRVDPVAAYRFQQLSSRDLVRFEPYFHRLAMLGYDLRSYEGVDKFWRLSKAERDKLYYAVQDEERFKTRIRQDFFEEFRRHFDDFQERFSEFFEHFQESEPTFDPEDLEGHYRYLGLNQGATEAELKERYRTLAFRYHPDKGGDEERMKALNVSYAAVLRAVRAG